MSDDFYGAEECEPQFDDKSNIFTHLNDSEEAKEREHATDSDKEFCSQN